VGRRAELRQYYDSFMSRHNLIREELDLLQNRVSRSIFIRHYWSASFKELTDRTPKSDRSDELIPVAHEYGTRSIDRIMFALLVDVILN